MLYLKITWLNGYNDRIRKIVGPELMSQGLTDVYYWMMNKTAPYELPSKAKKAQMNSAVHIAGIREIVALISFISLTLFS